MIKTFRRYDNKTVILGFDPVSLLNPDGDQTYTIRQYIRKYFDQQFGQDFPHSDVKITGAFGLKVNEDPYQTTTMYEYATVVFETEQADEYITLLKLAI